MKPLEQWRCDVCRELIKAPREGMLQWLSNDDLRVHGFRIVHNAGFSPRQPRGDCYYPAKGQHFADMHLDSMLGPEGLVEMLSFVDPGPHHQPDYAGPYVKDLREFSEIMRRLFVPYYEEARLYWSQAIEDQMFDDANEVWLYLPSTCKALVARYSGRDAIAEGLVL